VVGRGRIIAGDEQELEDGNKRSKVEDMGISE